MIGFLATRLFQQVADGRIARDQGLPVVQALGGDFTGMVDPHQLRRLAAGRVGRDAPAAGPGAGRLAWARRKQGAQGPVRRDNQLISKASSGLAWAYSTCSGPVLRIPLICFAMPGAFDYTLRPFSGPPAFGWPT